MTENAIRNSTIPVSADIEEIDARIWPTGYILSRLRWQASERVAACLLEGYGTVSVDRIFGLLEKPKREEFGLFSLPVPQLRLPSVDPKKVATDLAQKFAKDKVFTEAACVGPFLNLTVDLAYLLRETVREVLTLRESFGTNTIGVGKRVGIEFSSPNIAKPFHAGHLRSTIIGNFLKQTYAACGFDTIGINYLGDWGKQYGLLAVGFKRYGSEEELERDPIGHLYNVYVKINADLEANPEIDDEARAYFRSMEDKEPEALGLWRRFRDLSIERYKQNYARLNIHFEVYSGESLYEELMQTCIQELKDKGLLTESNGAQVVDLTAHDLGSPLIVKSDGATLYMTRDVAAAGDRFAKYNLDKSIYVVAMQQDLHLKQLFKIMHLMERPFAPHMAHVNFGMVLGMKTRKGTVVFLNDILDEAHDVMHSVMKSNEEKYKEVSDPEGTSDILAVSAIVIQDMSARRIKDYEFKIERVTQFEGDTGPYLQFAHSRLCSIERNALASIPAVDGSEDLLLLTEREALTLASMIARFPDVVQEARITAEPCAIVSYLTLLSRQVSTTLDRLWVMGQEPSLARARLALYVAARYTLGNGLQLLGLKPLQRM